MAPGFAFLLLAEFLSALADNALLFSVVSLVLQRPATPGWYVPALQASFLVAFVLLAPWVGRRADRIPKARILLQANLVKAVGAGLILLRLDPLAAYALVGAGAAMYSPAKYGILPELVPTGRLVAANGWIESTTIVAILLGTLAGAQVADYRLGLALGLVLAVYGGSVLATFGIPRIQPRTVVPQAALPHFADLLRRFLGHARSRFAVLGTSLFWGSAAVLRVALVAWAPLMLASRNATDISRLTVFLALGVVGGAALAPRWIPREQIDRARQVALVLGLLILLLAPVRNLALARLALVAVGFAGGLFVVPVNAVLQEIGHRTLGSGGAVAVQHFFENLSMLATVGAYTLASALGAGPLAVLVALGLAVMLVSRVL